MTQIVDTGTEYDAMQMEVYSDFRSCDPNDNPIDLPNNIKFINSMIEIIYVMNHLYEIYESSITVN